MEQVTFIHFTRRNVTIPGRAVQLCSDFPTMFGFRRYIQPADRVGPSSDGFLPPCQSLSSFSFRGTMTTAASPSPRGAQSVRQEPAAAPAKSSSSSSSSSLWSFLPLLDVSPSADADAAGGGGAAPSVQAGLSALTHRRSSTGGLRVLDLSHK